jgi:3-deoxy-D-manno-octulosonic-acid transferase
LFMCNAQYPSRSMARDARSGLRHRIMRGFAGAFVKSQLQADRFASVGVTNIAVTGELRFDQPVPPAHPAAAAALRARLAGSRSVVTFASVVEGEDGIYMDAVADLLAKDEPPFIVYVPRKPERFDAVDTMLRARGFRTQRRSLLLDPALALTATPPDCDVLLGDSMGEMYAYLALADRVVTGGGFIPKGAHNIIEPLALRKPVLVGPVIHTIEYPAMEAIAAGVCRKTDTPEALRAELAKGQAGDPTPQAIADFFAAHAGATAKTLAALDKALARRAT